MDTTSETVVVAIGDRIAQLLQERNQSGAWLADRLGVPRSTISRIIRGERHPTEETLRDVAIALAMSPEALLAGPSTASCQTEPDRTVSREHFDTAIEQMLRLERETIDLRSRAREAEEGLAAERTRRVNEETRHAAVAERVIAAERKARFHEEQARSYHDALELAVLDVAKLRVEVETLGKATENAGLASHIGAALAGIAAVASVAAYVTRAADKKTTSSKSKSSSSNNTRGK